MADDDTGSGPESSRRGVLKSIGAAGLLPGGAAGDLSAGGGPQSDGNAGQRAAWYTGSSGARPNAGVERRFFYDETQQEVFRDTGSSWVSTGLGETGSGGDGGSGGVVDFVDAVDDLGADPTGSTDVGQIIHDAQEPGRIIWFPEGEYLCEVSPSIQDSQCVVTEGDAVVENRFALVGPNATFVPADQAAFGDALGQGASPSRFIRGNNSNSLVRFVMSGITWDLTPSYSGYGIVGAPFGSLVIENIDVPGQWTKETGNQSLIAINVKDASERTVIDGIRAVDGSIHQSNYDDQPVPIYVSQFCNPDATVRLQASSIAGWPNNGIYGSATAAAVQVESCLFMNNDHANIRLGGNGSYVRGCRIIVNSDVDSSYETCRGIWLREESDSDQTDDASIPVSEQETAARVESTHITIEGLDGSGPNPEALEVDRTLGGATISDCVFTSNLQSSTALVNADPYGTQGGGDQLPEDLTHVSFNRCMFRRDSGGAGAPAVSCGRQRVGFEQCAFRAVNASDMAIDFRSEGGRNSVDRCDFYGSGASINWAAPDGEISYLVDESELVTINGAATRLVKNGESNNSGSDPRNGGPWNGNGRKGVVVTWTDSGTTYYARYTGGVWRAWSANA